MPRPKRNGPPSRRGEPARRCGERRNKSQHTRHLQPHEVQRYVGRLPAVALFALLDPASDLMSLLAEPSEHIVPRCPRCRRRAILVHDALCASCNQCAANWTPWTLRQRVLTSPMAIRRAHAWLRENTWRWR